MNHQSPGTVYDSRCSDYVNMVEALNKMASAETVDLAGLDKEICQEASDIFKKRIKWLNKGRNET